MVAGRSVLDVAASARPFSVDEFHRLRDAGVLPDSERVELLEGWIVTAVTRRPPHDARLDQAHEAIRTVLPDGWRIRVQSAITLPDSEPEPDLAVVVGPATRYLERHPGPLDIALVVEIADSSLAFDRDVKGRIYARAGIARYWIVDLTTAQVHDYTCPSGATPEPREATYERQQTRGLGDALSLEVVGRIIRVGVRDLLG